MQVIDAEMKKLREELDTDCDIKSFDLKRLRKEIEKVGARGDELTVRERARDYVRQEKLYTSAKARLVKITTRIDAMYELRVNGRANKCMVEFIECHNRMMASVSNPMKVQRTMQQLTMQSEAMKICEEMMEDAMAVSSEDEELEEADSRAVESLVGDIMNLSSIALQSKLPTIHTNNKPAVANTNPATTAKNIQQFLDRK